MDPSREFLDRSAADTGFEPAILEKVVRLGELAGNLARHPLLGKALALKGGTALNLCFGPPARMSVDLDYNYIARDRMREDRPRVETAVGELVSRLGYRIQRSREEFAGRKFHLGYTDAVGQADRIEIDLNFLYREPLAKIEQRSLWQPGELDQPSIPVVSVTELCVGKILAFLDRAAVRDAWDLCRLGDIAAATLAGENFRSWLIALSASLPHPLTTYGLDRMRARIPDRDIERLLVPMLSADARSLPGDLVAEAFQVVEPLLSLTPQEQEFVERIHRGEVNGDLLFPDDSDLAQQVERHPVIRWKVWNVRGFRSR